MIRSQEVMIDQWTKGAFLSTNDFTLYSVYKNEGFFSFSEIKKNQLNGYDLDPVTKAIVRDTAPSVNWSEMSQLFLSKNWTPEQDA